MFFFRQLSISFRTRRRWAEQGYPRDVPVVITPGYLIARSDGTGVFTVWYFDDRYMKGTIKLDDLWDRLSAHYPVHRTKW